MALSLFHFPPLHPRGEQTDLLLRGMQHFQKAFPKDAAELI